MLGEKRIVAKDIGKCGVTVFALERSGAVEHFID